jgi:hypothetical protein
MRRDLASFDRQGQSGRIALQIGETPACSRSSSRRRKTSCHVKWTGRKVDACIRHVWKPCLFQTFRRHAEANVAYFSSLNNNNILYVS